MRRDLPPNLYDRNNGYYCYRDPRTGKEFGLGRNKRDAINQAIEANLQLMDAAPRLVDRINGSQCIAFHAWLERYEEIIKARGLKKTSLVDYINRVSAIRTGIADAEISTLTTKDIAEFLNDYVSQGKNMRAKLLRSTLNDIFKEAVADGHIQFNPVDATRNPKAPVQRERLSIEDYFKIRAAADSMAAWVGLSMELALVTGQRLGDISRLKWGDVHDGRMWIVQEKTGAHVSISTDIELTQAQLRLSDVLTRCHQHYADCSNIIAGQSGGTLAAKTISQAFKDSRDASGLEWKTSPPSFHELRSLSARLHKNENGEEFSQHMLGHKSAEMTARYHDERSEKWVMV
ncbi:tyrosine-type recombinase/integrase [Serratia fonticola]